LYVIRFLCTKSPIQGEKAIDAVKINKEKASLEEAIDAATSTKGISQCRISSLVQLLIIANLTERMEKEMWDYEVKVGKKLADIDNSIRVYLEKSRKLQLIGPNSKLANGVNYQISLSTPSPASETELNAHMQNEIKVRVLSAHSTGTCSDSVFSFQPALKKLIKEDFRKSYLAAQDEMFVLQVLLNIVQQSLANIVRRENINESLKKKLSGKRRYKCWRTNLRN
jgi:hypothetical protein